MGLDMYLSGHRHIWRHTQEPQEDALRAALSKATGFKINQIKGVRLDLGYWRKANAIHNWFVTNVQNGEDNCREYYVSREKLQELRDACQKILSIAENGDDWTEEADEVLPPTEGFFFGDTNYNDYYLQDLKETIVIMDNILTDPALTEVDVTYQSSW